MDENSLNRLWKENGAKITAHFIKEKDAGAVKLCLDAGADVNYGYVGSDSIIELAIRNSATILKLLIKNDVNIHIINGPGHIYHIPLHLAVEMNKITAVRILLKHGADVNSKDGHDRTALHIAGKYANEIETFKILLNSGANINALDDCRRSPLYYSAVSGKDAKILKFLVERGADINFKSNAGHNGLHVLPWRSNRSAGWKIFINNSAGINEADIYGDTPLHHTCKWCQRMNVDHIFEAVKMLLDNGADISARDCSGNSALHYCVKYRKNIKIIKLLINRGADVMCVNKSGDAPLDLALKSELKDDKLIKYLKIHGRI